MNLFQILLNNFLGIFNLPIKVDFYISTCLIYDWAVETSYKTSSALKIARYRRLNLQHSHTNRYVKLKGRLEYTKNQY